MQQPRLLVLLNTALAGAVRALREFALGVQGEEYYKLTVFSTSKNFSSDPLGRSPSQQHL